MVVGKGLHLLKEVINVMAVNGGGNDSNAWCAFSCSTGCVAVCESVGEDNYWLAGAASMIVSVMIGYFVLGPTLG